MGRRKRPQRPDGTGRSQTSRFVRLDYKILTSNAYRSLSSNARSLLVELTMLYNSDNNGSLFLSVRDAAHRLGVADLTAASRAFDELLALGFIQLTQDAHFAIKAGEKSRARCWRLTWLPGPGRRIASWDFLDREPEPKTRERKRMERGQKALKAYYKAWARGKFAVLENDMMAHFEAQSDVKAVADSNTPNRENGGNLQKCFIPDSATHLAIPWEGERSLALAGWWQPDWSASIAGLVHCHMVEARCRASLRRDWSYAA